MADEVVDVAVVATKEGRPGTTQVLASAGTICLRILAIAAVLWVALNVFQLVRSVVLAVVTALLIGSVLQPAAMRLRGYGVPRALSAAIVFLGSLLLLGLATSFVINQVLDQSEEIGDAATAAFGDLTDRLTAPPWDIDPERIENLDEQFTDWVRNSGFLNADRAASIGGFATSAFSGLFIALTVLFFICKDGDRFPGYMNAFLGPELGARVNRAGGRIWDTTSSYLRGVGITGLVDGFFIGVALAVLGVPLAVPLALLTVIGAFIPVVGATIAGILAALVALATKGVTAAVIVAVVVLVVQQVEGNLLAPLLLGRAVQLHPVTILLALAFGASVAGIWGALLSVPATSAVRIALAEFVPAFARVDARERAIADEEGERTDVGPPAGSDPLSADESTPAVD